MRRFLLVIFLLFVVFCSLIGPSGSWRRRRRRRRCSRRDCILNSWAASGSCSKSCGSGYMVQRRSVYRWSSCGGTRCPSYSSSQRYRTVSCNTQCCPVNCQWTWNSWSPCIGCGVSQQSRTMRIIRSNSCGGTACPSSRRQTRSCNTGVCCPVNCVTDNWSSWSGCSAACEQNGKRVRTRSVITQSSCNGTPCGTLRESKSCRGPCCPRDCQVTNWSSWGKCIAPKGRCSVNSGTETRSRNVTSHPSCGGKPCPSLSQSKRCTPVPIPCKMNSWSSWSPCTPLNGKCGPGTQYQTRSVATQPYCSAACPASRQTRSCKHSCCPVDCVVSTWTAWSACSTTCGTGSRTRTRNINTQPSCGGKSCPAQKETKSCSQYNNRDCVMSLWTAWSLCSNGCGSGTSTRTRTIKTTALCRGKACGARTESKRCTDFRDNRDCVVNSWGSWGACSEKCAVGSKQRTRTIKITKRCQGRDCPALQNTTQCGTPNNGCLHKCSNGVCSCNNGYYLATDRKNCIAKDCKMPKPSYCAPGTALGSTCKHALVTCPGNKTTYPVTCSLGCPKDYSIKGASKVTCQTSGQWSTYATSYCRRNNDPPSQIVLSGSATIQENKPRGTKLGTFSSVDSNNKDQHTYSIVSGGRGKFELRGADLYTLVVFDYESLPNQFTLTIRSTDNGSPPMKLDKIFKITVADVNEKPTAIQLSGNTVDENSDVDTILGMLSTTDLDNGQTYSYSLLDSAGGRFKIQGNFVKVGKSNKNCMLNGGSQCFLNYESVSSYSIVVRSVDSGSPSLSINASFNISVNDVNDQPRGLQLSNYKVSENASINTIVGNLSATDEDAGQKLSFSLVDDDNGRFGLDNNGGIYKAKSTDYETSKVHYIVVNVTDNGQPPKAMTRNFSIIVLDVNEAPVSIELTRTSVLENTRLGTVVGSLSAKDNDAVQFLTFKLDEDSAGKFSLQSNVTCQNSSLGGTVCATNLLVNGDINYEVASSLDIIVRVTDEKGLFHTEMFNVTVINENDPPTNVTLDGSDSASVAENSINVQIDTLLTDDEDQGQRFTYVLSRNPGGNFEIRGDKLFASRNATLDFESSPSYQIKVISTDNGSPPKSIEATLVVNLQDVNEKPTDIKLSNNSVQENRLAGAVIGQLSVRDPDRQQGHVCSITDSANGKVGINNNKITVGSAGIDYEEASSFNLTVLCRDPGGLTVEKSFVILVQDINEAPTNIALSNDKVQENKKGGITVAQLNVTDPDNVKAQVQSVSFSILSSNPNLPFQIQNDALVTTRGLNFENTAQWTFRIKATDDGRPALSRTQTVTIQVIDVNDAPDGLTLSSSSVNENSDSDTLVGTLTALDQDTSQNHTFQLLDSASGRFNVDGNQIKVAVRNTQCLNYGGSSCLLNYEVQKRYVIRVKTTDDGSPPLSFEKDFGIDIRDVNDKPRDLQLSSNKVKEDAKKNTLIGRFSSRDEDANQTLTYSLKNDDSGRFKVDSLGNLYKANDTDYETQTKHTITAVVTDSGNPSLKMEKLFTIEVLNVNEAPVNMNITSQGGQLYFPDGHPQVRENSPLGTVIGMLEALDHDANQTLSFKLDDDAGGKFTLGPSANCQTITNISGVNTKCTIGLRVNGDLDFELSNEYHVTVRVTDAKGLFTAEQLRISIVDENDAPENITLGGSYSVRVYENANGSLVGQLVTSDEDVAQAHTYKLLDDASGRFVILNDKLYVSLAAKLDFEGQNNFTVKVRSTDSGSPSLSVEQVFEISILDVNEAPVNISLAPANVTENSQPGTRIGQLTVSDPDNYGPRGTLQTHSCQVTGSNIGKFTIQSNVLALGGASLDYELTPVTRVQVKCTDNGSPPLSLVRDLSINVNDVNEAPTSISLSSDAIDENQPPFLIGFFSTADPDNANQPTNRQTFTYKLMGDTAGLPFVIDGDALNSTRSLDYEAQRFWNITVQSVDSGNPQLSVVTDFLISVIDVNERPFNITLSNTVVDENCPQDTVVGNLLSLDPDRSQTHTYTMVNSAGGRFKLAGKQLKVAMSNVDCLKNGGDFCKLNYEKKRSYTVKVRVTDNGSPRLSSEASMVISLNDVNDRPNDFRLSSRTVKENATVGTKIGRFTATDEDQFQTLTFSLLNSDGGRFAIDSTGYLFKAKKTDYETSKAHKIVAQVTDNGTVPLNNNKTFIVVVENVNEPPINMTLTSTSGQQSFTDNKPRVNENSAANATVGTLQAFDHDEVQSLTFSLDDDANGKFTAGSHVTCHNNTNIPGVKTMCTALLQVSGDLNYEASHSEDIVVRVTDPSGLFHIQPLQVVILDVNDRPSNITLAGGDTASINENVNGGYVGDLVTTDEDSNQTHRYTWINNGGWKFLLRSNKIYASSNANLDYEAKSTFIIRVRSTDDGSPRLNIDKTFTVKVLDVNERPTDILLSSRNVLENSRKGTVVGNISVLDPDDMGPRGPWQNHSCRVLNPSSTPFKVNGTDNILVVDGDLNYEKLDSYSIDIRCHDNANPPLSVDKNFKINVIDVNEKPYDITISNNGVAENTGIVTVGSLDTADPDNELTVVQTFTYTIDAASGSVPFAAVHGLLNTTRSLDYEANSTWSLTIKSTDNEGLTTTKNFSIIVKDTNDPPTGVSASGPLSVNENSQTGEYIGSLTTSDQDVGQTHKYRILNVFAQGHRNQSSSSNLHNLFSIESPSGRITLQKPGLDYELYANYTVTVNSTDSGFPPYSILASFVVSVNNTNEQPQSIFLSGNQVPENSPMDTVVGDLSIYDPDNIHLPLQKFQCSVVNDKPFKVVNHLTLVVSKNTLDYETVDTYTVNVNCTELLPNPFSVSSLFVINIQDVNEAPYNLTISANNVNENGPPGVVVGTLSVHDPDLPSSGRANVSLALKYQTPGPVAFTLNGSRLVTTRKLNFETQDSYKVTVVATDSGNPPLNTSLTFTIQVIDVNDPPTAVKLVSNGIYENATAGTIVGVLQATDQDADQSHTFVVTGYGSDWFIVNGSNLRLKGTPLNYETTPVMNITILVLDNGSPPLSYKGNVSVTVLDSNDRPSDIIFNSSLSVTDSTSYQIVIPENSPSGTSLMNLSVVDEDFGQQHSCELVAGRNYFIISSASKSTSEITLKEGADLNYETLLDTLLKVSVECRDDGSPPYSIQKNFSVQVSDVNEAPYDIRLNGSAVVEENVRVGYAVGYLTCEDPDIGQSHMFTVIGNYSSVFEVNNSYNLIVKDPSHLDYENLHPNLVLTVAIQVTDNPAKGTGAPLKAIGNVTINITDINEVPHDIRLVPANVTVPENVSVGYCLAQIASRNPEKLQTVVYTLLNYQSMLSIEDVCKDNSSSAGHQDDGLPYLIVKSHLSYNDYVVQGYQILIEAEDNGIPPQTFNETVQIHVTKIDPCPQATCHVDATCSRVDRQNYTCACNAGYSGNGFNCQEIDECNVTCTEVDECIANPCSNGGTCHDFVNYYNCTCPSGYNNGTDCTFINFCSSSPCMNDATCNPVLNGYNCICPCGFTGKHCQTNIDDCVNPKKCFEGNCIDKNSSFICECESQFFGPQCRRMEGDCTEKPCGEQEICIPRNVERYNTTFCVSAGALVSLPFPEDEISNPYKHYQLERWFFKNEQQFPLSEITNNDDDSDMVSVTDVYVRQPSWEHPSKAKRSLSEENLPTLDFVVLVYLQEQEKYMGVPSKTVLCNMNKTCVTHSYTKTETKADFEYELCIATAWEVKKRDTEWCVSKEAKEGPLKRSSHKPPMNLYYVIAGIGGILLIVLITGLTLCRRNTLISRERKFMKQHRFTERRDTYIDNMHRHQRANQEMEALGTVNPIYGNEEQEITRREVARQINVMDNPLYEAPGEIKAKRSEPSRGFNNPMYVSFQPPQPDEKKTVREEEAEEACAAVGFANPMFASHRQEKKTSEQKQDDSGIYAVPVQPDKPAKREGKTPIYDTPTKPTQPVNEEPVVSGGPGFFNPLYQTRKEVEEFPSDITSIFAPPSKPTGRTLDDDLGQSDC